MIIKIASVQDEQCMRLLEYFSSHGVAPAVSESADGFTTFDLGKFRVSLADIFRTTGVRAQSAAAATYDTRLTTKDYADIVDEMIRRKPKEYGYDNIVSACSYAGSSIPQFNREGRAFSLWRDLLWAKCFEMAATAESSGVWPSPEDAVTQLPVYEDILASIEE